jgi:hypothetical protein
LLSARIPESVFKDLQNEEDFEDIRQEQEEAAAAKTSKPVGVAKLVEDTVKTSTPSSVRNGEDVLTGDPSSVSEASVRPPSAVSEAGGLGEAAAVEEEEEEDNSFDGLFHAFDAGMVKYHDNTTNNPLDNLKG